MRNEFLNGRLIIRRRKTHPQRAIGQVEGVQLASRTMAHELNNALTPAVGALDLAISIIEDPELNQLAQNGLNGLQRAADIITRMQRTTKVTTRTSPAGPILKISS